MCKNSSRRTPCHKNVILLFFFFEVPWDKNYHHVKKLCIYQEGDLRIFSTQNFIKSILGGRKVLPRSSSIFDKNFPHVKKICMQQICDLRTFSTQKFIKSIFCGREVLPRSSSIFDKNYHHVKKKLLIDHICELRTFSIHKFVKLIFWGSRSSSEEFLHIP